MIGDSPFFGYFFHILRPDGADFAFQTYRTHRQKSELILIYCSGKIFSRVVSF